VTLTTLSNGLRLVETLAEQPCTIREAADLLSLPRQSVYRLARTLVEGGWVDRDESTDTYSLSPRVWSLGVRSFNQTSVRDVLAPTVRTLAHEYGETVHLGIYDRGMVVYIDKADGSNPIRSYTELGGRAPSQCVATGKVLLADKVRTNPREVADLDLQAFTPLSPTDPDDLLAELAEVTRLGHAVNRGGWREGVGGLAVPILSPSGEVVAALGFSGPTERITAREAELLEALTSARDAASSGKDLSDKAS